MTKPIWQWQLVKTPKDIKAGEKHKAGSCELRGPALCGTHPGWASFRGSVLCRIGVWGRGAICGPNSDCRGEALGQCSPQCCNSLPEEEEQTPHRVKHRPSCSSQTRRLVDLIQLLMLSRGIGNQNAHCVGSCAF